MKALLLAFALVVLVPIAVTADGILVSFNGGIGVDPVGGISSGSPVLNTVCGVMPGGLPWRIRHLKAQVATDGSIVVQGRGLLLAGGNAAFQNAIGTNGGQSVGAELFCNTTPSSCGSAFTTGLVPLDPHGDFMIRDTLSPAPPPTCTAPVLLIVNAGGRWFAAGIPAGGDDD